MSVLGLKQVLQQAPSALRLMMDGASLGAALGVGFLGGVLGTFIVVLMVRNRLLRSAARISPGGKGPGDDELSLQLFAMKQRQQRGASTQSERELRKQLDVLHEKIDRLASGGALSIEADEGDWTGWSDPRPGPGWRPGSRRPVSRRPTPLAWPG